MADTAPSLANRVKQWASKFFTEYVRANRFKRYMGTSENSVIHIKEDLTKKKGDAITFSLVNALRGDGVEGSTRLEGNEEDMDNDGHQISVKYQRHAVVQTLEDEQATLIDFLNAGKTALKKWCMTKMKNRIIAAFMSFGSNKAGLIGWTNHNYPTVASEADKDAWLAANSDRVLFGAAKGNNSGNDHSASLANVDSANDKLSPAIISLAKRMAKKAEPAITPVTYGEDEETFVYFCDSLSFRDLREDATMQQANREAMQRGKSNPLFKDGDLLWDGVVIREIEEFPVLAGVGNGGIDVSRGVLCGQQALGLAWAKRTKATSQTTDYEFRKGVGVMESLGLEKLQFNRPGTSDKVDHGIVTVYTAAVADA